MIYDAIINGARTRVLRRQHQPVLERERRRARLELDVLEHGSEGADRGDQRRQPDRARAGERPHDAGPSTSDSTTQASRAPGTATTLGDRGTQRAGDAGSHDQRPAGERRERHGLHGEPHDQRRERLVHGLVRAVGVHVYRFVPQTTPPPQPHHDRVVRARERPAGRGDDHRDEPRGHDSVTFGGTQAGFTVTSANEISATVPVGAATGAISVTTPGARRRAGAVHRGRVLAALLRLLRLRRLRRPAAKARAARPSRLISPRSTPQPTSSAVGGTSEIAITAADGGRRRLARHAHDLAARWARARRAAVLRARVRLRGQRDDRLRSRLPRPERADRIHSARATAARRAADRGRDHVAGDGRERRRQQRGRDDRDQLAPDGTAVAHAVRQAAGDAGSGPARRHCPRDRPSASAAPTGCSASAATTTSTAVPATTRSRVAPAATCSTAAPETMRPQRSRRPARPGRLRPRPTASWRIAPTRSRATASASHGASKASPARRRDAALGGRRHWDFTACRRCQRPLERVSATCCHPGAPHVQWSRPSNSTYSVVVPSPL